MSHREMPLWKREPWWLAANVLLAVVVVIIAVVFLLGTNVKNVLNHATVHIAVPAP